MDIIKDILLYWTKEILEKALYVVIILSIFVIVSSFSNRNRSLEYSLNTDIPYDTNY